MITAREEDDVILKLTQMARIGLKAVAFHWMVMIGEICSFGRGRRKKNEGKA
jgi:hypothetical protein